MKKALLFLEKATAIVFLFFLPSQLSLHFWPTYAFVFGIRVDYLSPTIYFTDIVVLALLFFFIVNKQTKEFTKHPKFLTGASLLLAFSALNILISTNPLLSFLKWIKIFEVFFLGFYFYVRKSFIGSQLILRAVYFTSLFYSTIGFFQFFLGKTTEVLGFLGERSFTVSTPGIALTDVAGRIFLRPYSTFPHPNVFAGYLGMAIISLIGFKDQRLGLFYYFGILVISFSLLLTFSESAFLTLVFLIGLFSLRKVKLFNWSLIVVFFLIIVASVLMPVFADSFSGLMPSLSYGQRLDLAVLSAYIIRENWFFGLGLNNFLLKSVFYGKNLTYPWLLQPVHNIYLLLFAETGILGLLLFTKFLLGLLVRFIRTKNSVAIASLMFILLTGSFDHYWITLQQGMLTASLFLAISFKRH